MIKEFKHELLTGKPCMIEDGFIPAMNQFVGALQLTGCAALIISSFRKDTNVQGAIVRPAVHGDHLIGHAIDVNIYDRDGDLWTSSHEPNLHNPQGEVLAFIKEVKKYGIRWGGEFVHTEPDPVHFDDGLYQLDPQKWMEIYEQIRNENLSS